VNPGFCEKMEATRVPPGRPSVPQVGKSCICAKEKLKNACKQEKNVFAEWNCFLMCSATRYDCSLITTLFELRRSVP